MSLTFYGYTTYKNYSLDWNETRLHMVQPAYIEWNQYAQISDASVNQKWKLIINHNCIGFKMQFEVTTNWLPVMRDWNMRVWTVQPCQIHVYCEKHHCMQTTMIVNAECILEHHKFRMKRDLKLWLHLKMAYYFVYVTKSTDLYHWVHFWLFVLRSYL